MKNTTKRVVAVAGLLALGLTATKAQTDGALLDALVKKGVLSDSEAQDIRAKAAKESGETAASRISIGDYVQKLTIYGDARLRFEYADEKAQAGAVTANAGTSSTQGENIVERNRYRLRVGADYVYSDNFKGGFELESNTANDSANQTIGSGYNKANINIGLVYLQWKPIDWLTLTGGKQRNPLYTTDLMWDPDINPEGASEVASWTFPIGGDSAPARDPKDVKAIAPSGSDESLTVGLTAFQGIYADNSEFNLNKGIDRADVWQFVEQVPVQFNFNKDMFIKEVPGFDVYTGGGNAGPGNGPTTTVEDGGGTQNFISPNAADDLAIITAPGEFDWKFDKVPMKFYWDFAANLDGKARVQDVYLRGATSATALTASGTPTAAGASTISQNKALGDNIAWVAGLQAGQNKRKGDWMLKADYRQVGLGAVDPNLNDSDWGDSSLNQQGVKVVGAYNFTDFLVGTITVYDTWAYKSHLFAGQDPTSLAVGNANNVNGNTTSLVGLAAVSQTQRVDVDLQWKF
jgi:hypothetical protein